MHVTANNNLKLSAVNPLLASRVRLIIESAARQGVTLYVDSGYRSSEEQNKLYAQGRTTPGEIVTYKRGGESQHNFRNAVDLVPILNGRPSWSESFDWSLIGRLASQVGLNWGGNWNNFVDRPHVELPKGAVSAAGAVNVPQVTQGQIGIGAAVFGALILIFILD